MSPKREDLKSKIRNFFQEWIWGALLPAAFIAFCIVRPFIVQAFKIPTGSMRTTLLEGDLILVNKFIYGAKIPFTNLNLPAFRNPKRGDVIVFIYPGCDSLTKFFLEIYETMRSSFNIKSVG